MALALGLVGAWLSFNILEADLRLAESFSVSCHGVRLPRSCPQPRPALVPLLLCSIIQSFRSIPLSFPDYQPTVPTQPDFQATHSHLVYIHLTLIFSPRPSKTQYDTMLAFTSFGFLSILAASLSLCGLALAGRHEPPRRRHPGTNYLERDHTLSKRFDNARFTFYEAGQGACGGFNSDSDFVSLNSVCARRAS